MTRVMISIAVMLVAILEVMDITIVNVALPNMMGSLGANTEQISWVLTSYIVSAAIIMLLTGFLVDRFGRKNLIIYSIIGFMISSCLCGMAETLTQIVIFRAMQGVFGATLVPLSQYILIDTFPKEKQGVAMAIWGMGIMVAPVFGPTLGGLITDAINWRWTFFINMPVSLIALAMCFRFIKETPTVKKHIDTLGLILMTLGVGCLQIFLDQGNNYGWLNNDWMLILFITTILLLSVFVIRGLRTPGHIVNLHLFRDRNFALSTIILAMYCAAAFGIVTIQPLMLENLLNYTPKLAGLVLAPRGIACAISLLIVAKLIEIVDLRVIAITGLLVCAFSAEIMSRYSLDVDVYWVTVGCIFQGIGMGMIFVPITTLSTMTLKSHDIAEATGIFNFGRSLGTSVGISMIITLYAHMSQSSWAGHVGRIKASNPAVLAWLNKLGLTLDSPEAAGMLSQMLHKQTSMVSFVDCYNFSMYLFLAIIPLLLLIRKKTQKQPAAELQSDKRINTS